MLSVVKLLTHFLNSQQGVAITATRNNSVPPVYFLFAVIYESVSSFWSWLFGRSALSIQMCPAPVIPRDKLILIYIHRGQVSLNYCYLMMIPVTNSCRHHQQFPGTSVSGMIRIFNVPTFLSFARMRLGYWTVQKEKEILYLNLLNKLLLKQGSLIYKINFISLFKIINP